MSVVLLLLTAQRTVITKPAIIIIILSFIKADKMQLITLYRVRHKKTTPYKTLNYSKTTARIYLYYSIFILKAITYNIRESY